MSCPFANVQSVKPTLRTDPKVGTRISFYDQETVWTAEHRSPSELNEWRKQGDPVIDTFFEHYGDDLRDGDDTYDVLDQLADAKDCSIDLLTNFRQNIRERPSWFDRDEIQRGQRFFLRHSTHALTSIFHYTLILGYGFQQLNDVLLKTQYLSSSDLQSTFRRLVETFQMIGTAVCGDVDEFEQTFADVVRVRLLHGMVRSRLVKHRRQLNEEIPINQEDLLITLLGFSFSVLYCMEERMNIPVTDDDKRAYLHLWRYIGWLIGIEDEHLTYLHSYRSARTISESIFYHFYFPSSISKHMAHHSLMASYVYSRLPLSFRFQLGLSQLLLGNAFSRALDLDTPSIDRFNALTIRFFLSTLRFSAWLSRCNSPRLNEWIIERQRQRLCFLIYTGLNNELCQFSLFKTSRRTDKSLGECSCRYFQKKRNGFVQTNDIGPIRMTKPFPLVLLVEQSVYLLIFVLLVRFYSSINV